MDRPMWMTRPPIVWIYLMMCSLCFVYGTENILLLSYGSSEVTNSSLVTSIKSSDSSWSPSVIEHKTLDKDPYLLAYNPSDKLIYYLEHDDVTSLKSLRLNATSFNESETVYVFSPASKVGGIIHDPVSAVLYYTDSGEQVIGAIDVYTGGHYTVLSDVSDPGRITLARAEGVLYWVKGNSEAIMSCKVTGTEVKVVEDEDLGDITALLYSEKDNKLHWTDSKMNKIEEYDTATKARTTIFEQPPIKPYSLALLENTMYFIDSNTGQVIKLMKIVTTMPNPSGDQGSTDAPPIHQTSFKAVGIGGVTPYKTSPYDMLGWTGNIFKDGNQCASDNGGCSHLCLSLEKTKHQCTCPDGYTLYDDKECVQRVDKARGNHIIFTRARWSNQDGGLCLMHSATGRVSCFPILDNVTAVPDSLDYDCVRNIIYWYNTGDHRIYATTFSGSNTTVIATTNETNPVIDMTVEPIGADLYYTVRGVKGIYRADLKHGVQEIFTETKEQPGSLVFDHVTNELYWTYGELEKQSIMKAKVEENPEELLVTSDGVDGPKSLTLDYSSRSLYWVNKGTNTIEKLCLKSGKRSNVLKDSTELTYNTIAVDGGKIYMTDLNSGYLKQTEKGKPGEIKRIGSLLDKVGFIRFITEFPFHLAGGKSVDGCRRVKQHESVSLECHAQQTFTVCIPQCPPKYEFVPSQTVPDYVKCVEQKWQPERKSPHCIRTDSGRGVVLKALLHFRDVIGNCSDPSFKDGVKRDVTRFLRGQLYRSCTVGVACIYEEMNVDCLPPRKQRTKRQANNETQMFDTNVQFTLNALSDSVPVSTLEDRFETDMDKLLLHAHFGTFIGINGKPSALNPWYSKVQKPVVSCQKGFQMTVSGCIPCRAGEYFNFTSLTCQYCPTDTYQDEAGQNSCKHCPEHTYNNYTGSYTVLDCIDPRPKNDTGDEAPILRVYNPNGYKAMGDPPVNGKLPATAEQREAPNRNLHLVIGGTLCVLLFIGLLIVIALFAKRHREDALTKERFKNDKEKEAINSLLDTSPSQNGVEMNGPAVLINYKRQTSHPPIAEEEDWFLDSQSVENL